MGKFMKGAGRMREIKKGAGRWNLIREQGAVKYHNVAGSKEKRKKGAGRTGKNKKGAGTSPFGSLSKSNSQNVSYLTS